ncbi:MAG TPA: hypothetical protein VLC91_02260 [Spongiibacteraceae bacterium]|nr:hypothetical protein [Spongiibacteraceae bacterium]
MHDLDTKKNSGAAQPDHLLDELTSIKDILADTPLTGDIPLLDDLVVLPAQSSLLDIERIFNDDVAAPLSPAIETTPTATFQFPKFTLDVAISDEPVSSNPAATDNTAPNLRANHLHASYRREVLIQELIAEFVPQIEAALRERLERLDNAALQALKSQP